MNEDADPSSPNEPPAPRYREILRFYFPLALSWIFMAMEMPIATAVTSHSIDPKVQAAALLLMMGLALFIESPIIDLLATSTTLTKSRADYLLILKFVLWLMALCTVAHAAFCLTPLFEWVTIGIMNIPRPVVDAAHLPMLIMLPWSAAIGWRRFLQGILIRSGQTRMIGFGTGVRVLTIGLLCLVLFYATSLSGVTIAAIALATSVTAEATFIHFASRPVLRAKFGADAAPESSEPLEWSKLIRFHFPLTATTMTFMLTIPLVGAALAQTSDGVLSMAAWQISTSLIFLHRTIVFALPEPIIALYRGPKSARKLARFSLMVGGSSSLLMLLIAAVGADRFLFVKALGAPEDVAAEAAMAYILCSTLPVIGAVQSYLRGMLTAHHLTVVRFGAILVYTVVLVGFLWLGVAEKWPGVWVAAIASTASALAEVGILAWAWIHSRSRVPALPQ